MPTKMCQTNAHDDGVEIGTKRPGLHGFGPKMCPHGFTPMLPWCKGSKRAAPLGKPVPKGGARSAPPFETGLPDRLAHFDPQINDVRPDRT
jgi:hypothetical protein